MVFSLVALVASPLLADEYNWVGADGQTATNPGDWNTASNWEKQDADGSWVTATTAPGTSGTVTIDNGHVTISPSASTEFFSSGTLTIGDAEGKTASLAIATQGHVYLGNSNGPVTMKILPGGTLYPKNDKKTGIWIGHGNYSNDAHLIIDGGSVGTSKNRFTHVILTCNNDNNSIELNSGEIYIDEFWLSGTGAASTFNMIGGTLDVSKYFQIGRNHKEGVVNISGGTVTIGTLQLHGHNGVNSNTGGGTLNIIGNKSDWTVGTLSENTYGKLNFIAGHVNEDGSFGFSASDSLDENGNVLPAFSTINVSGTATLKGTLSVDMPANYFYGDVVYLTGDLTQTLISATGGLTIDETTLANATVTGADGWRLDASDKMNLVLTPDNMDGWVEVSGDANSKIDFTMEYTNDLGTAETFVDWLNTVAEKQGYQGAVALSEAASDSIVFSDLLLDANGIGHLYLDYGAYNSYHHEAFPEPATWAMLVIGASVLVLGRRKR